jgi:hypothetical protein
MPLNASHIYPPAKDPDFTTFPSRRSVVHGTQGIVSSTQPLASQAGVRILKAGGNAAVGIIPFKKTYSHLTQCRMQLWLWLQL